VFGRREWKNGYGQDVVARGREEKLYAGIREYLSRERRTATEVVEQREGRLYVFRFVIITIKRERVRE
jgi:hypothetical protein